MKKYLPVIFLLIIWGVWEAVAAPERLILVGGFVAVGTLLFLRWRAVPWCIALALCVGFCVYAPGFFRYVPVFLLCVARRICPKPSSGKKKAAVSADGFYTVLLIAVLCAVGTLIYDIFYSRNNIQQYVLVRQHWWLFGAAFVFAAVLVFGRGDARRQKGIILVYAAGFVCLLCAAVGFLCNSVLYALNDAVFPWLLFLTAAAAQPDEVITTAAEKTLLALGRFLSGREETV